MYSQVPHSRLRKKHITVSSVHIHELVLTEASETEVRPEPAGCASPHVKLETESHQQTWHSHISIAQQTVW